MPKSNNNEKVMIFIDGGYMYKALKNRYGYAPRTNIPNLISYLSNERVLRRIYYYNAYPPLYSDTERYNKVQKLLWQIEQKTHKTPREISLQIKDLKREGKNYEKIAEELDITSEEMRAEVQHHKDKRQLKYYDHLSFEGIKVKLIKLKRKPSQPGGYMQKGVDVFIATDMLSLAFRDAYDTGILISGDADYVKVIEEIQELGKIIELASFEYGKSYDLHKVCDKHTKLDPVIDRFVQLKPKKSGI